MNYQKYTLKILVLSRFMSVWILGVDLKPQSSLIFITLHPFFNTIVKQRRSSPLSSHRNTTRQGSQHLRQSLPLRRVSL